MGFGVWGLGFGVWGLGFGVWGLGFGVWGLGFRAGPYTLSPTGGGPLCHDYGDQAEGRDAGFLLGGSWYSATSYICTYIGFRV